MRGGYAMYWNPASLGMRPRKGAKLPSLNERGTGAIGIHAGLGVRVWYFSLDAAVMFTPSTTNLNTSNDLQEVPERSGFALMLGFNIPI